MSHSPAILDGNDGHSWWFQVFMDLLSITAAWMATNPAMITGVVRDHVGPFCLSLGDQMSCVGVDSPDVHRLSQPFNKRLCTPIMSSWFTGMQDFPGLCLLSCSLGTSPFIMLPQGGGEGGLPCSYLVQWGGTAQQEHSFMQERSLLPVCPLF